MFLGTNPYFLKVYIRICIFKMRNQNIDKNVLVIEITLLNIFVSRVAPDTEFAGYLAAGYPANLFCRISGIRPDS